MPKTIRCPSCNHQFAAEVEADQLCVYCDKCGAICSLPETIVPEVAKVRYCTQCGEANDFNAAQCHKCGAAMISLDMSRPPVEDGRMMGGLIPRNTDALLSYYTGIISMLPPIGAILGFYAVWKSFRGLSYAKEHPNRGGTTHSIVGMICGIVGILLGLSCVGPMIFYALVEK